MARFERQEAWSRPEEALRAPGKPNLCQLLINLKRREGFHQVVIGSSDERTLQLSHAWRGNGKHYHPGIVDRFLAQAGYKLQAVYVVQTPIDQDKVGGTHRSQDIHRLLTVAGFCYFEAAHGE